MRSHQRFLASAAASALLVCAFTWAQADQSEKPSKVGDVDPEPATIEARKPVDCPDGVEHTSPARTVLQVIDLTVYRWAEYDMAGHALCVVQERPRQRVLTADETADLLERSTQWQEQLPDPDQVEMLSPDDPSLSAEPAPVPRQGLAPDGWSAPSGPDREYRPEPPPSRQSVEAARRTGGVESSEPPSVPNDPSPQVVIGDDDRVRVSESAVQTYPWNTIGYHRHQYPNDEVYRCTAFLVGPHLALTNGHCIYNEDRDGFLRAAEFSPGQFQSGEGEPIIRPYGTLPAYRFRTNSSYIDDGFSIYDYGGLNFSRGFDGITTYMPLVFNDPGAEILNTSGYSADVHLGTPEEEDPTFAQWFNPSTESSIGGTDDRLIYHDADTIGGHSGSPLWRLPSGEDRRVIAIHCCGSQLGQVNYGPRLVDANQSLIEGWMDWTPPADPGEGDEFGALTSSSATGSWSSSNLGATLRIGEADHCGFEGGHSMWRAWTAPVSRSVEFFTNNTDFDVLLGAYTGNSVAAASEVACDGSAGVDNSVGFAATTGQTYHIAIDGYGGEEGDFQLNWLVSPPPNDDFSNSWILSGQSGSDSGDNHGATFESGESDVCGYSTETTVWWTFTAPEEPGILSVDTVGSDFDALLAVSTGNSVDDLFEVTCDGSAGSENSVEFSTTPASVYRIAVAGWSSGSGAIQLNWGWQASGDEVFSDRFEQ